MSCDFSNELECEKKLYRGTLCYFHYVKELAAREFSGFCLLCREKTSHPRRKFCEPCKSAPLYFSWMKYLSIVYRSEEKEFPSVMTFEEFESLDCLNVQCFYCGSKSTGLDRVDNSKGYVLENCVACCWRCNSWKSTSSFKDFVLRCRAIADRFLIV